MSHVALKQPSGGARGRVLEAPLVPFARWRRNAYDARSAVINDLDAGEGDPGVLEGSPLIVVRLNRCLGSDEAVAIVIRALRDRALCGDHFIECQRQPKTDPWAAPRTQAPLRGQFSGSADIERAMSPTAESEPAG